MDVKTALKMLADKIKEEVLKRMESERGVNLRTGENTLKNSKLYKSVEVRVVSEDTLAFQIADYYTYVVGGRRPGWGTPPPTGFVQGVTNWVRERGIRFNGKTENQTIWAIIKSIVKRGIQGRAILGNGYENDDPSYVLPFLDDFFDEWSDKVFEDVCKMLDEYFSD